jgi:hypothetical protein
MANFIFFNFENWRKYPSEAQNFLVFSSYSEIKNHQVAKIHHQLSWVHCKIFQLKQGSSFVCLTLFFQNQSIVRHHETLITHTIK